MANDTGLHVRETLGCVKILANLNVLKEFKGIIATQFLQIFSKNKHGPSDIPPVNGLHNPILVNSGI